MALHDSPGGAIAPTLLPFPRTESRDPADLPELTKLLGKVYDMHDGIKATLVVATAQILVAASALGSRCLYGVSTKNRTVAVTTVATLAASEAIAGFTFPGLKQVEIGEYFWLLMPGVGGRVSVIADAGAVSAAGVFLEGTTAGAVNEVVQSTLPGVTPLLSTEAAVAAAACECIFYGPGVF